ncbi:MAG TPA: hypothetical protein VG274_10545 [Rhizomicrobium sp.]|nr:hypothetical protein [Rhizomicrobium sp.]
MMQSPRQQSARELYWRQLAQLKADNVYIRLYRDDRSGWVSRLGILRAVASSGSIAAWAIWREYAFVWALVIAASQVADVLKDVFPFARQYQAAGEYMLTLDRLLIDAEMEWSKVFRGDYPEDDILDRRRVLMTLQLEAQRKSFPSGLPPRNQGLWEVAEGEAAAYLSKMYSTGERDD